MAVGGLVLGALALAKRMTAKPPAGRSLASAAGKQGVGGKVTVKQAAKDKTERLGLFEGSETSMAYAGAGGAIGGAAVGAVFGAAAGPIGAVAGFAVGLFAGAVVQAMGQPSYGRIVRDAVASQLRESGYIDTSAAVDAGLWRNALLGAAWVWRHDDGRVAIEVTSKGDDDRLFGTSLTGATSGGAGDDDREFIPGFAGVQSRQSVSGSAPGMLDGPNRRRKHREWIARARVGDLFLIEYIAGRNESWRTPGYVWFQTMWPQVKTAARVARAGADGWTRIVATEDNVDVIAEPFDRAAGITKWAVT